MSKIYKKKISSLDTILNEDQLQELKGAEHIIETLKNEFNLLLFLQEIFNENVWTRVFAFLLKSKSLHNLGSSVFKYWFQILIKEVPELNDINITSVIDNTEAVSTRTEWCTPENRRIDLVLELNDCNGTLIGVIGLENKVNSSEQEEQLSDYQKALSLTYKVPMVLLYCTPDGRKGLTADYSSECHYFPISYKSFQNTFQYFTKSTEGELKQLFISISNYLTLISAEEKRRQILSFTKNPDLPFNERNQYSPVLPFFGKILEYFKVNKNLPFQAHYKTFSTNEIDFFIGDWHEKGNNLKPCYMIHFSKKEPGPGDYYVIRLMIHSKEIHKKKVKDKQPILQDILKHNILPNSRNTLEHWDPWVNIWTSSKYELVDLGEKDIAEMLNNFHKAVSETYVQLKDKFPKYLVLKGK